MIILCDKSSNYCYNGNHITIYIYIIYTYQINMYTLNLHSATIKYISIKIFKKSWTYNKRNETVQARLGLLYFGIQNVT